MREEVRIQSSGEDEQTGVIARSLHAHSHLTLCSHAPVSLPGDSSVLLEEEEEVAEEELEEAEGPNPTIPSSNSSISRCHCILNSSITRPVNRNSSSPTPSQKASTPSTDTGGGATKVGSRAAGITTVTARTGAGTSSTDSRASGTPKRQTA